MKNKLVLHLRYSDVIKSCTSTVLKQLHLGITYLKKWQSKQTYKFRTIYSES